MHNAKCTCQHFLGCYVDYMFPPPPGYKCTCKPVKQEYFIYDHYKYKKEKVQTYCEGTPTKCSSYDEEGCSGCAQEECCLGNCGGYHDSSYHSTKNIVNCTTENAQEDDLKSDLSETGELKDGSLDVEEDSYGADTVNETLKEL